MVPLAQNGCNFYHNIPGIPAFISGSFDIILKENWTSTIIVLLRPLKSVENREDLP